MYVPLQKGNLVFLFALDPRFWSTGDLFFRNFYILPWNNGSIPWNNMDQFYTDNFIVILNFTASNTDFSDVSSFSCYVEISITGVRFSSPPPSKTAYFRRFNCFTWNILDQPWNNGQKWPISLFCTEPKFDQKWLQIHYNYKNNILWYNFRFCPKPSETVRNCPTIYFSCNKFT